MGDERGLRSRASIDDEKEPCLIGEQILILTYKNESSFD